MMTASSLLGLIVAGGSAKGDSETRVSVVHGLKTLGVRLIRSSKYMLWAPMYVL